MNPSEWCDTSYSAGLPFLDLFLNLGFGVSRLDEVDDVDALCSSVLSATCQITMPQQRPVRERRAVRCVPPSAHLELSLDEHCRPAVSCGSQKLGSPLADAREDVVRRVVEGEDRVP